MALGKNLRQIAQAIGWKNFGPTPPQESKTLQCLNQPVAGDGLFALKAGQGAADLHRCSPPDHDASVLGYEAPEDPARWLLHA